MNILCEYEVEIKGEVKKLKLTMRSLIQAQTALECNGIKELGEMLENLNPVAGFAIIAACADCKAEDLYDEDIPVIPLCLAFLGAIVEAFTAGKKKKPSKKK